MNKATQSIPPGHENLIPHLVCSPCAEAIEFYKKAFGAEEMHRIPAADGHRIMHAAIKNYVKPVVEIMAALPSVVLGFFAGLWLAPVVERVVPGLFLMPAVVAVAILGALLVWRTVPAAIRGRFRTGTECSPSILIPTRSLFVHSARAVIFWLALHSCLPSPR